MEQWESLLKNINLDLPADGKSPPPQEYIPKEIIRKKVKKPTDNKVIVQKISTDIIVTTDIDGKITTTNCFQSIIPLGEMPKSEVTKVINEIRESRKKETE